MNQNSLSTSSTFLPALSTDAAGLPVQWVEALFSRLTAALGGAMANVYAGVEPELVKHEWGQALAGFSVDEVKRGLAATRMNRFAPNLGEFLHRCRPSLDDETAWHEAARAANGDSATVKWSHPVVRQAASNFNWELRTSNYVANRKRWGVEMAAQWESWADHHEEQES